MTSKNREGRGGDPENEWISRKFIQEITSLWDFRTLKLHPKFSLFSFECLKVFWRVGEKSMHKCKIPFLILLLKHDWGSLSIPYFDFILELTDAFDGAILLSPGFSVPTLCLHWGLVDGMKRPQEKAQFAPQPFYVFFWGWILISVLVFNNYIPLPCFLTCKRIFLANIIEDWLHVRYYAKCFICLRSLNMLTLFLFQ